MDPLLFCGGNLILERDSSKSLCSQRLNTQGWFPRQIKLGWREWSLSTEEALLWRINFGCRSGGKPACVHSAVSSLICDVFVVFCVCVCVCVFVWQFHDLLSQTTSPLSQMDPYTSRSMDMLLPLTESDRRRRGGDQDCSVSLRSYSERPRSVVSSSFYHLDRHQGTLCHSLWVSD